jgi:uncharacterized protein YndB with AHSA1/START domain
MTTTREGTKVSMGDDCQVAVSRRIEADAATIFAILADPNRHTAFDGSGMLRGTLIDDDVITGVGDVFVLQMYFEPLGGDYEMANEVVEFESDRRIIWEPRRNDVDQPSWHQLWGYELNPDGHGATIVTEIFDGSRWPEEDKATALDNGKLWIEAMTDSLERLEAMATCSPADDPCRVTVSRRIEADAATIFAILADPTRHTEIDGSEMLRGALTDSVVTGVGDDFVLNMYLERLGGDYQMANRVVEFEQDRRIAWEPRRYDNDSPIPGHIWGYELEPDGEDATVVTETFDCAQWSDEDKPFIDYGRNWIESMRKTMDRLEKVATGA